VSERGLVDARLVVAHQRGRQHDQGPGAGLHGARDRRLHIGGLANGGRVDRDVDRPRRRFRHLQLTMPDHRVVQGGHA
jgi:hypothetical protein